MDSVARAVRHRVYRSIVDTGAAPPAAALDAAALRRLHDAHQLVLDADGEVRMALPFANVDTPYAVEAAGRRWRANCAWDAIAIVRMLALDEARVLDAREPRALRVEGGALLDRDGTIGFPLPARLWWRDIVFT
jgi:hypothetical protein